MKMLKKLKAGILIFALLISTAKLACVSAADGHLVPGTGPETDTPAQYCNNTYRTYTHIGCDSSIQAGEHMTSGGIMCKITVLNYVHRISCSVCKAYFTTSTFGCTQLHSSCGTTIVNHPAY